jgi:hypothetical protein
MSEPMASDTCHAALNYLEAIFRRPPKEDAEYNKDIEHRRQKLWDLLRPNSHLTPTGWMLGQACFCLHPDEHEPTMLISVN